VPGSGFVPETQAATASPFKIARASASVHPGRGPTAKIRPAAGDDVAAITALSNDA
jgi:hypothetical protein